MKKSVYEISLRYEPTHKLYKVTVRANSLREATNLAKKKLLDKFGLPHQKETRVLLTLMGYKETARQTGLTL